MNAEFVEARPRVKNQEFYSQFRHGSISEISSAIDQLDQKIREQNPGISVLNFYREFGNYIPRIPFKKEGEIIEAAKDRDGEKAKEAKKVLTFITIRTVLVASEYYFTKDESENENIVHAGIAGVLGSLGKLPGGPKFRTYVYNFSKDGIADYFVKKGIPRDWTKNADIIKIRRRVESVMRQNPKGISWSRLDQISNEIAGEFGVRAVTVSKYLNGLNLQIEDSEGTNPLMDEILKRDLRRVMINSLDALLVQRPRSVPAASKGRDILILRTGMLDGEERKLKEIGDSIGVTGQYIRSLEKDALKKLRHPRLSKKLRDFLDPEGEPRPIRYNPSDFKDSRNTSNQPLFRVFNNGRPIVFREEPQRAIEPKRRGNSNRDAKLTSAVIDSATKAPEKTKLRASQIVEEIVENSRRGPYLDLDELIKYRNSIGESGVYKQKSLSESKIKEFTRMINFTFINPISQDGENSVAHLKIRKEKLFGLLTARELLDNTVSDVSGRTIDDAKELIARVKTGARIIGVSPKDLDEITKAIRDFEQEVRFERAQVEIIRAIQEAMFDFEEKLKHENQ